MVTRTTGVTTKALFALHAVKLKSTLTKTKFSCKANFLIT